MAFGVLLFSALILGNEKEWESHGGRAHGCPIRPARHQDEIDDIENEPKQLNNSVGLRSFF